MRRRIALAALALGLGSIGAALEPPEYLRVTWGVLLEGFLDPALAAPGNPVRVPPTSINFNFGGGVSMPFSPGSRWAFAPSGDVYFYNAQISTGGQAVATAEEQSSAFVLGLILNAPITYSLPLGDKVALTAGIGACLDLRAAFTTDSAKAADTPLMNRYLWDKGRFFTPATSLRGEYKLSDRVGFGFVGRALWPIYNLWTNEGFGFLDQGKYFIDLVLTYRFMPAGSSPDAKAAP